MEEKLDKPGHIRLLIGRLSVMHDVGVVACLITVCATLVIILWGVLPAIIPVVRGCP